jgi:hypothetical protein
VLSEIKGLLKIQLKDNNFLSGLMTLMKKLESPTKIVLDSFTFDESILIGMHNISGHLSLLASSLETSLGEDFSSEIGLKS